MTTHRTMAIVLAAMVAAGTARAATPARTTPTNPKAPATTAKAAAAPAPKLGAPKPSATGDSTMTLRGGQEGTVFRSLTVEGEDRIHYEVARPELRLEMDPSKAPGLEWGSARDVLDRTVPDEMAPLLGVSAKEASPYTARPWLSHFVSGSVARFHPEVEGVDHWKLTVANWRGEPVTAFSGKGDPPKEIAWDGRDAKGAPVMPGATYSYVFEAEDRAGNRRHFVGEGFRAAAFRVENASATTLVFTGAEMATGSGNSGTDTSPLLLEAASWLNQTGAASAPITVTATARSADEASALGNKVQQQLAALTIGEASRIRVETRVESDAPPGGAASVTTGRAATTAAKTKK